MTKEPKLLAAIICDDVRREITGKEILIGVYAKDIVVHQVPAIIPIALWVKLEFPEVTSYEVKLRVVGSGGQLLAPESEPAPMKVAKAEIATLTIPRIPISVQKNESARFEVNWGTRWELIAAIDVRISDAKLSDGSILVARPNVSEESARHSEHASSS